MSIGEAKRLHRERGLPVMICYPSGKPVVSDLFNGIPYLLTKPPRPPKPFSRLVNAPGCRPYITAKTAERWTWRPYQPEPADIVFTAEELAFAEPYRGLVMVEPNVKDIGHRNKDWGWANWWKFDAMARFEGLVQCVRDGDRSLPTARRVLTNTFRQTAAVLSVCRAFVGSEGGLMHAAAAVGVPSVVLFGEFISPNITGYEKDINLFASKAACGMRTDCPGCRKAMSSISPNEVFTQLQALLGGGVADTPSLFKLRGKQLREGSP